VNILNSGISNVMPGNIEQAMMIDNTRPFAQNRSRASAYAPRMPRSRVSNVVVKETITELSNAWPKPFSGRNTAG